MEQRPSPVDAWLRRAVLAAILALLVLICHFVWQLSMVAREVQSSVAEISSDLRQVMGTAAQISQKVDRLTAHVDRLQEKAGAALHGENLEALLEAAAAVGNPAETPAGPEAEREIQHLLEQIRNSGLTFAHGEKTRSAAYMYLKLQAKYKIYRRSVSSAEEFIAKVATRTIGGNPYHVLAGDERRPLDAWLREALARRRAGGAAEEEPRP